MRVTVLGAGSWGTTVASLMCRRDHEVLLWARNPDVAAEVNEHRTNDAGRRLPCSFRSFRAGRRTPRGCGRRSTGGEEVHARRDRLAGLDGRGPETAGPSPWSASTPPRRPAERLSSGADPWWRGDGEALRRRGDLRRQLRRRRRPAGDPGRAGFVQVMQGRGPTAPRQQLMAQDPDMGRIPARRARQRGMHDGGA